MRHEVLAVNVEFKVSLKKSDISSYLLTGQVCLQQGLGVLHHNQSIITVSCGALDH